MIICSDMPNVDWNERYLSGDMPWDTGVPNEYLVAFVRERLPGGGRALDVGCGTGTQSLWLAGQGFSVLGIDVSGVAVEKARSKAAGQELDCRFETADFLRDGVKTGPFDLVLDLGCLHLFDGAGDRERFAARVGSVLAPGGRWLSLIGSTEGPDRDFGPPRRSAWDVIGAIEPSLRIEKLRAIELRGNLPEPVAAWLCVSRPRSVPAQPSTRR